MTAPAQSPNLNLPNDGLYSGPAARPYNYFHNGPFPANKLTDARTSIPAATVPGSWQFNQFGDEG